jgi:predicted aldo/keto reductase-like oxidoreductase
MIYKEYGKTGKQVSALGFGGMRFDTEKTQEENAELLFYAREKGINFFDTAPDYCKDQSEDIFGLALNQMQKERDRIYVCTKGMPTTHDTAEKARTAVKKSLQRLNLDRIDFYYVWCIRKMAHYELALKPGGQYEGLLHCQEEGLIDHIVLSTHLPGDQIRSILQQNKVEGILAGINILNFPYRWDGVQAAYDMGYGVAAMNPLGGGLIPKHEDKLGFLAEHGLTPTQAALRFVIGCPQITVALNGFTTRDHIDMACETADTIQSMKADELDILRHNLGKEMNSICTGCGYCMKDCPQQIPVAGYMQYYNEKALFGKSDEEMIKGLPDQGQWQLLAARQAQAADCNECGQCEDACTQHLPIIDRLQEFAQWEAQATQNKQ